MQKFRLLMIDDEPDMGVLVRKVAEPLGYDMRYTDRADTFEALYRSFHPDLVILDLAIPGTDGIELLQFLAKERSPVRVLLMSGLDASIHQAAGRLGEARGLRMAGVVAKPVRLMELRSLLKNLVNQLSA